jgi:predicted nucleic acid-binding protein
MTHALRAVLDTKVLVSALVFWQGVIDHDLLSLEATFKIPIVSIEQFLKIVVQ